MPDDTAGIEDIVLLSRAVNDKDRIALQALHAAYYCRVEGFIISQIGSVADVEDLAQEVFLQVWKSNIPLRVPRTVEAYLFGIARHVIGHYLRNGRRRRNAVPLNGVGEIANHRHSQPNEIPPTHIPSEELKELIEKVAAELSYKIHEALILRFVEGLSIKEAAREARCSEAAFYRRVERGVQILRQSRTRENRSTIDDELIP